MQTFDVNEIGKNLERVKAREEATKLARKLGDEAWEQGQTKHALEAYEASDITSAELFEMAKKLLKAEELIEECYKTLPDIPYHEHVGSGFFAPGRPCFGGKDSKCKYHAVSVEKIRLIEQCLEKIFTLLGWEIQKDRDGHYERGEKGEFFHPSFYRAAALACLKLIKRM